jgi:precorrin-6A/cobalt-precorrin-6A reductase
VPPGATVFLATGRQTLQGFSNMAGRRLICRQIDVSEGPFPFENGEFLIGRPPFPVDAEIALFARLGVDWLVVKNAGGALSISKLVAARLTGLPVLMIRRPDNPDCARVETVGAALAWLEAQG